MNKSNFTPLIKIYFVSTLKPTLCRHWNYKKEPGTLPTLGILSFSWRDTHGQSIRREDKFYNLKHKQTQKTTHDFYLDEAGGWKLGLSQKMRCALFTEGALKRGRMVLLINVQVK